MTASVVPPATARSVSSVQQWWVLTVRMVKPSLRNGEVGTLAAASVMFTAGFYISLKEITGPFTGMSSHTVHGTSAARSIISGSFARSTLPWSTSL